MGLSQSSTHNQESIETTNNNEATQVNGQDTQIENATGEGSQPFSREKKIEGLTRLMKVTNSRRKDVQKDDFDYHKESMGLLKHIFRKMDPSVTHTTSMKSHGDLELSFKYDSVKQVLLIKVIRGRNIVAKDLRGKSADAYVKLTLIPSRANNDPEKTKIVPKTLDPVFHEIFEFSVSHAQLKSETLVCQVWDHDMLSNDDFIGETLIPLSSLDLVTEPVYTGWYSLSAETDLDIHGSLDVSLTYSFPRTLSVTVHCANNLTNRYEDGAPNPFVKLQVPGQKMVETKVKENTVNPVWEETFVFRVPPENFSFKYIVLHAIDYDDAEKNDSLGQVIIELKNFDPHSGFKGTFELSDLKNNERLRDKFFKTNMAQEFKESLVAHACAKYPQFLFHQQDGSKMIRVRNLKARSEAKLRMIDGVPMY